MPSCASQLWNEDVKKRLNYGQTGCSLSHLGLWAPKPYKGWELEGEDDFFVGPTFGRDMPALVAFVTLFAAALDSMGIDVILTGYHIAKQLDRWAMLVNLAPKVLVPLSVCLFFAPFSSASASASANDFSVLASEIPWPQSAVPLDTLSLKPDANDFMMGLQSCLEHQRFVKTWMCGCWSKNRNDN